ncbi:MAG: peptide-N(4)-(N-acetyl-beta-glucosaminyl)asparagine amidase [Deltaproteobacteria bacterium]|nr:MAG: peptide-N(4)-(N-acetyl-beta-glucosaminyl)asparagine amidase [Deltaproteobacteria bacterium]TMB43085.1 MAG: peptide-N(4)-(N-acetyl-beta-glucosaminyl)asparagine amidase [Deltaproteobacteria bacterium]
MTSQSLLFGFGILIAAQVAQAQPVPQSPPTIGSPNTVTADPPVARPRTTPCRTRLFTDVRFADFSPKSFAYAPPSACPGPWQNVVLEADWSVEPGRQFDRTANLWIGGVNVYFGTTAEPTRPPNAIGRSWHVERDITDYTAALLAPAAGRADLGNLINDTYTSALWGTAQIAFYPFNGKGNDDRRSQAPDLVLPLSSSATGGTVALFSPSDALAATFHLPTNVERAFLDVILEHQGANDEFWYTCVPSALSAALESCSGGAFREGQVSIDGQPAGVVPIFPWIFTGGIDPYLWRPIPAVQALNFVPYRVDLTPFAGVLSDGQPHTLAIRVANNSQYFSTTATLLVFLDHGSKRVTGQVTTNTIGAPIPSITTQGINPQADPVTGTVTTISSRSFVLAGWVRTSRGKVQTEIRQTIDFSNVQDFVVPSGASTFSQKIAQLTSISSVTKVRLGDRSRETVVRMAWPLKVEIVSPDNFNSGWTTNIHQSYDRADTVSHDGDVEFGSVVSNSGDWADDYPTTTIQSGAQRYFSADSEGHCYSRSITAAGGVLTSIKDGKGCDDD